MRINKYSSPKRYMPDYRMSMSHADAYMREVDGQGYIDGELYDELYTEYCQKTLISTLKKHVICFLEKHIWKFIIIYCAGALALLVWFIGWVIL